MVRLIFFVFAVLTPGLASAGDVPLPRPRPPLASWQLVGAPLFVAADLMSEPSACQIRLQPVAQIEPIALLNGSDECGGDDMVRLKAVIMPDKTQVAITPPAQLRCRMAEQVAAWVREDITKLFPNPALRTMVNYDAYECRPRNRVMGARLSEHSRGNALDVRSLKLADGKVIDPTDVHVDRGLREALRAGACARFSTVLGPGSDGHHESHIHVDLAERRSSYSLCQWVVREPPKPSFQPQTKPALGEEIASVDIPLPRSRPSHAGPGSASGRL